MLAGLGMQTAFAAGTAEFTGIAPRSKQITLAEAFHRAFVVDEKGTEAAVATAVVAKRGSPSSRSVAARVTTDTVGT